MVGAYSYTPLIWPSLAIGLLVAVLGLYSWRRREVPGARYFALACTFWVLALLGNAAEHAAANPSTRVAWHTFQALWQLPLVSAIACFILEYVQPGRWLTRQVLLFLTLSALLLTLLIVTNDLHNLFWRAFIVDTDVHALPAAGGWLAVLYVMLLAAVQAAALLWLFVRSPQHRWPVALMLGALVLTRTRFLAEVINPDAVVSPAAAVALALLAPTAYAVALFGFKIFDPMPAAQQAVLAQMAAGVVVFDTRWRVFSLNPAAEAMLGQRSAAAQGHTWRQLAPDAPPLPDPAHHPPADLAFECGGGRRCTTSLSSLHDFRGLRVGYLLLLTDVTEEHRTQAQLLAQQRALAALHEREQFARDLHDGIAQVVGYAGFQVDAAVELIEEGKEEEAEVQLIRLAGVLREAHADLRAQILNLRTVPSAQQPFFAVVRHYLDSFTNNYGIAVELTIGAGVCEEMPIAPDVQIQLSGILQEALTNVRKHSRARCVQVTFCTADDTLFMRISDDGAGFAQDTEAEGIAHWGLQFMRERAAEMGGVLHVTTSSGAGAAIVVEIPWKDARSCV